MPSEVVVIGAGGFGREALDVIEAHNEVHPSEFLRVLGVVDDAPSDINVQRLSDRGYAVLGPIELVIRDAVADAFVLGVGAPRAKHAIADRFEKAGWRARGVIHPAAVVSPTARIGDGAIVCGGVQLSTNTRLGRHVHLNPGTTVGHDATLGDFSSVNPGAILSGEVVVEKGVLIGAGAVVLQGLTIGADAVVGASACVTRDVRTGVTVAGVPARILGERERA